MTEFIITIDGPAGSGKSSTAKLLAEKLGATFLDTGATYRAATLAAIMKQADMKDIGALEKIIDDTNFKFDSTPGQMTVKIDEKDCTEQIREPEVTQAVAFIASVPSLREKLVKIQRALAARHKKVVAEGRDQGTVVFPNADYKFFLTANSQQRAKRRSAELTAKGHKINLDQLQQEIEKRDHTDKTRDTAPLVPAAEAVIIDNSEITLEQTVDEILKHIEI
ncbi:MAG: (d)CMP kinase [Sedimentisphaerales bacterium]|nr:(d)CMP kinase [Sedimentisphaerales bacterium]